MFIDDYNYNFFPRHILQLRHVATGKILQQFDTVPSSILTPPVFSRTMSVTYCLRWISMDTVEIACYRQWPESFLGNELTLRKVAGQAKAITTPRLNYGRVLGSTRSSLMWAYEWGNKTGIEQDRLIFLDYE